MQRIIAHEAIYDALRETLTKKVGALVMGDPKNEDTFIGPMISEKEATRLHGWINEAVAGGAKVLTGGHREGVMLQATLLEDVPASVDLLSLIHI